MNVRLVVILATAAALGAYYLSPSRQLRNQAQPLIEKAESLMEKAMQQKATAWVFALGEGCATHVVITTQQPGEDQATFCRRHSQAVKADAEEFQPKAGELPVAIDVDNNGDVTVTPQR